MPSLAFPLALFPDTDYHTWSFLAPELPFVVI